MDAAGGGSSSSSSLVILSVSLVGILGTALLLLSYYLFLTRCGLLFFWRADQEHISSVQQQHHHEAAPRRSGLEEAAIRRIPTFRHGRRRKSSSECAVCLADFRDGERLRLLPACRHAFHIDCIDAWLQANANCPLCRAPIGDDHAAAVVVITHDDDIAAATSSEAAAAAEEQPAATSFLAGRRSLSMDSCTDNRFYLALQRILQQQQHNSIGEQQDAAKLSSRRLRRSFFSFSHSLSLSRGSSILPL